MASIGQGEYPLLQEIKKPSPLGDELPTPVLQVGISLNQNWDKNGNIYYTDENGNRVGNNNFLNNLGNRVRAFGENVKDLLNPMPHDRQETFYTSPYDVLKDQYNKGKISQNELVNLSKNRMEEDNYRAEKEQKESNLRSGLGTALSGASFLPVFNIPKVGTGIGGAMYDVGQGIVQGETAPELWDRAKRGFVIGETVGAIPYAGKGINKLSGGKIGDAAIDLTNNFISRTGTIQPIRKISNILNQDISNLANINKYKTEKLYDLLVDESGNARNFYHGTPNAGFTEFKTPSHFSENIDYAGIYKNPSASSMGPKQTANNPGVYEVNLDVNKMFDTRNPIERDIFNNEYQAYYSPELTKKGLPDWMEAEDLIGWLKEKYPEYDALIVDEGGTGGYGSAVVDRGESYLPFNSDQILIKNLKSEKPVDLFEEITKKDNWHKKQSNLIKKFNKMNDDYHTGIRSSKDIKTPDEAFNIEDFIEYPDFKYSDAVKARRDGFIKVYSSKPISEGGFVTPSKMNAKDYAGNGEIHEAIIPIKDVAWIDSTEGQYAPITHTEYGLSNTPLKFTGKTVKIKGKTYQELDLSKSDYRSVLDGFNNHLSKKARKQLELEKNIGNTKFYIVNDGFNEPIVTWEELIDKKAN